MDKILVSTNAQKILDFLIRYPARQFLAKEIQKATKVSKGGVSFSLRSLAKSKFVRREKKGKIFLYTVDHTHPLVKQLKVLRNIKLIISLVNRIKSLSEKIVLFGSSSRGENYPRSDIDLFILTHRPEEAKEILKKQKTSRKFQAIVKTPVVFAEMQKREPVFFEEISRGITLWERNE